MLSKRTFGLLAAAFVVLVLVILACSLGQVLATRVAPTALPTRTPRPTWTGVVDSFVEASATPELAQGGESSGVIPQAAFLPSSAAQVTPQPPLAAPMLVVGGGQQPITLPMSSGAQNAVVTIVVVLVTATPPAPAPASTVVTSSLSVTGTLPASPPAMPATPVPSPSVTPPPPVLAYVVPADGAYVRQGPADDYPPMAKLNQGQSVTVVGRDHAGDWWKLCCVNYNDVWIASSVVTVTGQLWTVPEASDFPPEPTATFTPGPTDTPAATPTQVWVFYPQGTPQAFTHSQDFFMVGASITSGGTPVYGYKLLIRKLSTGQQWLSNGSDAFFTTEPTDWQAAPTPTPAIGVSRNVKWDSLPMKVHMGTDTWEVTVTDGGGMPLSAPVFINTSEASPKWYYLVFASP